MLQAKQIPDASSKPMSSGVANRFDRSDNDNSTDKTEVLSFLKYVFSDDSAWQKPDFTKSESVIEPAGDQDSALALQNSESKIGPGGLKMEDFTSKFTQKVDSFLIQNKNRFEFTIDFPQWGSVFVKAHEHPTHWHFGIRPQQNLLRSKVEAAREDMRKRLRATLGKEVELDVL